MLTAAKQSDRDRVIAYLWERVTSAFGAGKDEEAFSVFRFVTQLEEMTDAEYLETYEELA